MVTIKVHTSLSTLVDYVTDCWSEECLRPIWVFNGKHWTTDLDTDQYNELVSQLTYHADMRTSPEYKDKEFRPLINQACRLLKQLKETN